MQTRTRARLAFAVIGLAAAVVLQGGCAAPLSTAMAFGPDRLRLEGPTGAGLEWLPDGEHYLERRNGVLYRVDARSGDASPAYPHDAVESAICDATSLGDDAMDVARRPAKWSTHRDRALYVHGTWVGLYDFTKAELTFGRDLARTASSAARESTTQAAARAPAAADRDDASRPREITLSPDGRRIAFVRGANLHTITLDTGAEHQLTHDGGEFLLNGLLDWVYQEEVFGRGTWRGYWWRDDGESIAFLQLDETGVPRHPLVDQRPSHPQAELQFYPRPGDTNPRARIGVVPAAGGPIAWVDLSAHDPADRVVVHVGWTPDGRVLYAVQNRVASFIELYDADPASGASRRLLRDEYDAWVEMLAPPMWLDDGSFLWLAPRDGHAHVYHCNRDGALRRRLTAGQWEVNELLGLSADQSSLFMMASVDSPVEQHAYRVRLAGGEPERLTEPGGSHDVKLSPNGELMIDSWSALHTPPRVAVRSIDGRSQRVIGEASLSNRDGRSRRVVWGATRRLRLRLPDERWLNAVLVTPPDVQQPADDALLGALALPYRACAGLGALLFGPGRISVVVHVYAGPRSPMVRERWSTRQFLFTQWLAAQGFLVWVVDPRSASGESWSDAWLAHGRLCESELRDILASLDWLAREEPRVDLSRVAIAGHSFGGTMASYAITHSDRFKAAIAAAPVTDWRYYDSIYTERLMGLPTENADGYDASSVVKSAANAKGVLLLGHGGLDDNVHVHNTLSLAHALQAADKPFEMMIYPDDDHGLGRHGLHWAQTQLRFLKENLR